MTRRNKEIRAEERDIQDGARSPRASTRADRQADWGLETAGKLARYARVPSSAQSTTQRGPETRRPLLQLPDSEGEESEREGGYLRDTMSQAVRPKERGERGADASPPPDPPEPTLSDVLHAVNKCNHALSSLTVQFESFKEDITHVKRDIQKVAERTTRMETRISEMEDQFTPVQRDVRKNTQVIAALLAKTDDLENRSRRNNVRLVGVPEKIEGSNPSDYFESWLVTVFGKETLSSLFAVERAHRVPLRPLPPGAPPRPVLIKLLHFKDRDTILRKARDLPDAMINGCRVSFYPDFSAEVQKRRMQFLDVKKRLRNLLVPYAMLYPAKLRVAALGTTHFFELPKDASSWLDNHESQLKAHSSAATGGVG